MIRLACSASKIQWMKNLIDANNSGCFRFLSVVCGCFVRVLYSEDKKRVPKSGREGGKGMISLCLLSSSAHFNGTARGGPL